MVAATSRRCLTCGIDISERWHSAVRCVACGREHEKKRKRDAQQKRRERRANRFCQQCEKRINTSRGHSKFCSSDCRGQWQKDNADLCSFEPCEEPRYALGLCAFHYGQQRRCVPLTRRKHREKCEWEGCSLKHFAQGLCRVHHYRRRRGIDMNQPIRRRENVGAVRITTQGYVKVKIAQPDQWVVQHRDVMERHLGRPLYEHESIHHKNGDKADNRLMNLELWTTSHPYGQRVKDKVSWAREILAVYEHDGF